MKKAIAYLRVSTKEQGDSRLGLEAQRHTIQTYAALNGYELVEIVEEVASGKYDLTLRPVLRKALADGKRMKCSVLVSKLDRLSREVAFISALMAQGVRFVVTELGDNVDPLTLHIHAAVAEAERRKISQRTKEALQRKKQQGVKLGNPQNLALAGSTGRDAVIRQADDFAQRMRPTIERMRASKMTLQAIARELNGNGTPTARGGLWTAKTVCNLLSRINERSSSI